MMTSRFWPAAVLILLSLWLWSAAFWTDPKLPEGWKGVDLDLGRSLGRDPSLERQRVLIATVNRRKSFHPLIQSSRAISNPLPTGFVPAATGKGKGTVARIALER
jgi:hypothetical protein